MGEEISCPNSSDTFIVSVAFPSSKGKKLIVVVVFVAISSPARKLGCPQTEYSEPFTFNIPLEEGLRFREYFNLSL